MDHVNQKIVDAIITKAKCICPDSLELIGLYGSAATGDIHTKSDIDLLILINDDKARCLADTFILDDVDIGYDIYCTSWEMLESDARCNHAQLSKLLDSKLIYVNNRDAVVRLEELRNKAFSTLNSDEHLERAFMAFGKAKEMYANCFLCDSLSEVRTNSGAVINYLLDSVMLYHGAYFKKGVKRTFEELSALSLRFNIENLIMSVISAENVEAIRVCLTTLMKAVQAFLTKGKSKEKPSTKNLSGTYEEMFSNWRNKVYEAAASNDLFSSFMSMASCQFMINGIAESVDITKPDIMSSFSSKDLQIWIYRCGGAALSGRG